LKPDGQSCLKRQKKTLTPSLFPLTALSTRPSFPAGGRWDRRSGRCVLHKGLAADEPFDDDHEHSGPSKQHKGWLLKETISMINSLGDQESNLIGGLALTYGLP
jgi:hypothetical protein